MSRKRDEFFPIPPARLSIETSFCSVDRKQRRKKDVEKNILQQRSHFDARLYSFGTRRKEGVRNRVHKANGGVTAWKKKL